MVERSTILGVNTPASLIFAALALAGCQTPKDGEADFQALAGGSFENTGAVIEEPNLFRIVGGKPFQTPFSMDCSRLSADLDGWKNALAAGAHRVAISLPGQARSYGGVLALCTIRKSAAATAPASYQLAIPASKIPEARDGAIAAVAQQIGMNRQGLIDFAWMLWFTDRPSVVGVSFTVSGLAPVAPPAAPKPSAPKLVKGGSYTVGSAVNLRSGPGVTSEIVTLLSAGDALVATGDEKSGFWAVTTVGGQTGWVSARNLKPN